MLFVHAPLSLQVKTAIETGTVQIEILQDFHTDSDEWQDLVWKQGKEVVEQVLIEITCYK